jgi:hypothetical protein
MELTPSLSRVLIRGLTRGTAVPSGARHIHVGDEQWLAAQEELLNEIAEDGHSDTKFVRGAYGAGKSHFLSVVQDFAREKGWMTSHVECKVDGVQIDRFDTIYPKIATKLLCAEVVEKKLISPEEQDIDPCRYLLERWVRLQLAKVGIREEYTTRPLEAEYKLFSRLQETLLRTSLSSDFTRALCAYARAFFARDEETSSAVIRWLRGDPEKLSFPELYLQKPLQMPKGSMAVMKEVKPIGRGTANEVMRGLLWLVYASGFKGLVLCIDEVEELAKLPSQKRKDQALQALREYVDHAGGEGGYRHLCLYLAATPEMFDGADYFPRYDALATRIAPVSDELNWRAPVIDIDRTPLREDELVRMALKICRVHRIGYAKPTEQLENEEIARTFVKNVLANRTRIAKPRLLARVVVDELERARQKGDAYAVPHDFVSVIDRAAQAIRDESKK